MDEPPDGSAEEAIGLPGIVGLSTKMPFRVAESELLRMVEALRHERFYDVGTWTDESLGLYVGWAVRRSTPVCSPPVRVDSDGNALVFCGEGFPQMELLRPEVARLSQLSDRKASFLAGLNGRFHGLLTDRRREEATLFNDRYGMRRLYYYQSPDAFYFAAEAKAILRVQPGLRRLDSQGVGEFLACGCVLENRTIFRDIHILPPASAWTLRDGCVNVKSVYFDPRDWEEQTHLTPDGYYGELRDVFSRALPRYFTGSEPTGMSVTGGLDTRMILAWHKPAPDSLPCYTFGSAYRDTQDVTIGRRVARARQQRHHVITVGAEFLSRFSDHAERTVYLTDGSVDVGHAADLYVNQQAREIAPVRMTGNYGGEVLRRVRAFKPEALSAAVVRPELQEHVRRAHETYGHVVGGHPLSFAVFRQAPWHHYGLLSLEETQLAVRSPFLDNDFVRTVYRAPDSMVTSDTISLRLIAEGDTMLGNIRTDRRAAGFGRGPYAALSQGLSKFSFRAEYAYNYGMPQWLARVDHALAPLRLDRMFLGRHKFTHFRVWYRDELAGYLQETLLDSRTLARGYFDPGALKKMVLGHIKGHYNYTSEIHKALTLELIHRLVLKSR